MSLATPVVQSVARKLPCPEQDRTIRVSITFKIGYGWRGTKSRDFPGSKNTILCF
jgi:hypothetical protein